MNFLCAFSAAAGLFLAFGALGAQEIVLEQPANAPLPARAVVGWGDPFFAPYVEPPAGLAEVTTVAAGGTHGLGLRPDATVVAWGGNFSGEATVPAGLANVQAIAAGYGISVALRQNGTVTAWGDNNYGVVDVPPGLQGVTQISALFNHVLARRSDGTVAAWGYNQSGQCNVPAGLGGVTAVAAGALHSLALKADGTVVGWGSNDYSCSTPPAGLTGVVAIGAGDSISIALKSDGTVVAWGYTGGTYAVPPGLSGVQSIAVGGYQVIARKADSTLVTWGDPGAATPPAGLGWVASVSAGAGYNLALTGPKIDFGSQRVLTTGPARVFTVRNTGDAPLQLGGVSLSAGSATEFLLDTTGLATSVPPGGTTTFSVAFRPAAIARRLAMVKVLSNDADEAVSYVLLQGMGLGPEIAVFNGASTAAADERQDDAGTWNFPDTLLRTSSPAQTFTIKNVGNDPLVGLALSSSGAQAGDFAAAALGATSLAPGASTTFTVTFSPGGAGLRQGVVAIASDDGDESSFRIRVAGTGLLVPNISVEHPTGTTLLSGQVVTWGLNNEGQQAQPPNVSGVIGLSAGSGSTTVVRADGSMVNWGGGPQVTPPAGAPAVIAARTNGFFSAGQRVDRTLFGWGSAQPPGDLGPVLAFDLHGAAGLAVRADGTLAAWSSSATTATQFPGGLSGMRSVAVGASHGTALRRDGTVVGWGGSVFGPIVPPAGLTGVAAIASGASHVLALRSDGTVVAWGINNAGQCNVPAGLGGVQAIACGDETSLAIKSDGTLVAWGDNSGGQLNVPAGLGPILAAGGGYGHTAALVGSAVDFATLAVGQTTAAKTFTVRNSGLDPLTITSATLGGPDAAHFLLNTTGLATTLPATNGQTSFSVTYAPTSAGRHRCHILVRSNDVDTALYTVALTGTATGAEIQVFTGDLASGAERAENETFLFPFQALGTQRTQLFTIFNAGTSTLTGLAAALSGTSAGQFTFSQPASNSLAPGASTTFSVTYVPTQAGSHAALLSLASNDFDENPFRIPLTGTADINPEIAVFNGFSTAPADARTDDQDVVIFPETNTGSSSFKNYTIKNEGTSTLTGLGISVIGANPSDFFVNNLGAASLAPGATTTFSITFRPRALGERSAKVLIASNDFDENPFRIPVQGNAHGPEIRVYALPISAASELFDNIGSVDLGTRVTGTSSSPQGVLFFNVGDRNLTGISVNVTGSHAGDFLVTQPAASLIPSEATQFQITFRPSARGLRSAVVPIVSNDGDENPFRINVTGTGQAPEIALESPPGAVLGRIVAGGANNLGQSTPPPMSGARAVSAGSQHGLALYAEDRVVAWGRNNEGQGNVPAGLSGVVAVVAVAAGYQHSLALKSDGTVLAWGRNNEGQCNVPAGLSGVAAIVGGFFHSAALKADGTVVAWGGNNFGQCNVPAGLTGVVALDTGLHTLLALKADGTLVSWGYNVFGQATIPPGLSGVRAIGCGPSHSLAVRADGTVAAWGYNEIGETNVPGGLSGVVAVSGGALNSIALRADGSVVAWGDTSLVGGVNGATGLTAIDGGEDFALGLTASALDFGTTFVNQPAAPQTITVRNSGLDPLQILGVTVVGAAPGDFTVDTSGLPSAVPAGGTGTIVVRFEPTTTGLRKAYLRVTSNDLDEGNYEVQLTGTGQLSALDAWRLAHLGSALNSGLAANGADFDGDGVPNLVEYAFGLDPARGDAALLPGAQSVGGQLRLVMTPPVGVTGVTIGAEWATSLATGASWTPVTNSGVAPQLVFAVPTAGQTRVFLRWKVSAP